MPRWLGLFLEYLSHQPRSCLPASPEQRPDASLHPAPPPQLVYGGREDLDYYGDLWLLDIAGRSWRRLEVAAGVAPSPRDHHSAAVFQGEMVVFGELPGRTDAVVFMECSGRVMLQTFLRAATLWPDLHKWQLQGRMPCFPRFEQAPCPLLFCPAKQAGTPVWTTATRTQQTMCGPSTWRTAHGGRSSLLGRTRCHVSKRRMYSTLHPAVPRVGSKAHGVGRMWE